MTITVSELRLSRSGSPTTRELVYRVLGTADDANALSAAASAAPATHDGLPLRESEPFTIEPEHIDTTNADQCIWRITAHYEAAELQVPEPPETGETVLSFECGGGTLHISHAIKHIAHYEPGGIAGSGPNFNGAINVVYRDGKPEVQGVDVPQLDGAQLINVTAYKSSQVFTSTYRRTASRLANHVNSAAFTITGIDEFAAGEVLFLGLSASRRGVADWELQYRFAIRPNVADACSEWAADKPGVAVPKRGWEYIWCAYGEKVDENRLIPTVRSINVEQVLETGDLSVL